ncbi:hypothetical protein Slin15195_G027650 [Septoria linicola]|uniref:Uncharacterized protein n=1 Tax=Septoria linicola TaxID=215465 RepID=A0A9Q9ANZ6_9PEZI|nr:hypothetical protein Slin15195_G027650 [Septoria linicola]
MPHLKFDDTTLEAHVFREDDTRYVRLLTTNRALHDDENGHSRHATASAPSYPPSLMPLTSKKRKQKAPFCLSFSRRLDRFHESPGVYDSTRRQPLPFMLRLPAELRQQILDIVLDDDDVLFPRPNSRTQALALTCKTFAMDVREVMKLWEVREGVLRSQLGTDREGLSSYMQDLLAPLKSASMAYGCQYRVRAKNNARRTKKTDRRLQKLKMGRARDRYR